MQCGVRSLTAESFWELVAARRAASARNPEGAIHCNGTNLQGPRQLHLLRSRGCS